MGLLRLLLALSVLLTHAGKLFNYNIANSNLAVLSFYLISGFYMALILDKKYYGKKVKFFWGNRFLRIFPVYWITLLILIAFVLLKFFFHLGTEDNAITHYILYAPKTSPSQYLFDIVNFIFRNVSLIITADYFRVNNSTPGYLLIPQAWTLQIELLFYLIAPFLIKLSKRIFIYVSLIYVFGFFGLIVPSNSMQPTLLFQFLNYLIYFLLGIIAYRFIYKSKFITSDSFLNIIFFGFIGYLLLYNFIPLKIPLKFLNMDNALYYLILAVSLPFMFFKTSANLLDNFIGKLSYPVYITHLLVVKFFSNLSTFSGESNLRTILIIFVDFVIAYLALKLVEEPIDRIRQKRISAS